MMMLPEYSIDISTCVTRTDTGLARIFCLNDDNYCCQRANSTSLIQDTGQRVCCSFEEYSDQQWVTLAAIEGYSILLTVQFIFLLVAVCWFYISARGIRESDVRESRRRILKHLLKQQILHKSRRTTTDPSIMSSLRNISRTLSSKELRGQKNKNQVNNESFGHVNPA